MMRDATKEELQKIDESICSISIKTGANFWDLIENSENTPQEHDSDL